MIRARMMFATLAAATTLAGCTTLGGYGGVSVGYGGGYYDDGYYDNGYYGALHTGAAGDGLAAQRSRRDQPISARPTSAVTIP